MKHDRRTRLGTAAAMLLALTLAPAAAQAETLAVKGEKVWTMAGRQDPIENGVVIVEDGKITAVGPASAIRIPAGARVLEAAVVTPGLIDAHSVVGLAGWFNQPHDQDQLENSGPIQPELRAIDGFNARARLIAWVRSFGVTTIHTGHGPGQLISGQTLVAKTHGDTVDDAVLVPAAMMAATLGRSAMQGGNEKSKKPGTRPKAVAMLRTELTAARAYVEKMKGDKKPDRDLRLEALAQVLAGELPLMVTAHRHQDIMSALRLKEEFGFELVLDGAAESYELIEEIRRSGVPVIVHPPMKRAFGELENAGMETAAKLDAAGIPIAMQSGFESYVPKTRVVLLETAIAVAYGLPHERALAAMTIDAARLLKIDHRVGSLEEGKDGDLALYDGDPFEYLSHCTGVIIDGWVVSEEIR